MKPKQTIITVTPSCTHPESQEWARMLVEMYWGWCAQHELPCRWDEKGPPHKLVIEAATPATLRLESGVHRLARVSPLDDQRRRHTSCATVQVRPGPNAGAGEVRSYVLDPYAAVTDRRSKLVVEGPAPAQEVLRGAIDQFWPKAGGRP